VTLLRGTGRTPCDEYEIPSDTPPRPPEHRVERRGGSLPACSDDSGSDGSSVEASGLSDAQRADIDDYVSTALDRYHVPGAVVAVIQGDRVLYRGAFRVRGTSDPRPVGLETRFMIGSVTKSMTSLLMASLADDGLLDWGARVTDTFPSFALSDPASTPAIRVRDLVNHSSGVPQFDIPILIEAMPPSRLVASIQDIPVQAAPGQLFGYSNRLVLNTDSVRTRYSPPAPPVPISAEA
jgi:CubicO group peptidase (beta-lactamase class C family)